MAIIPGTIPVTGTFAPTDSTDTFAIMDMTYVYDGLRNVANNAERNAITDERRKAGMIVGTQDSDTYWKLLPGPWTGTDLDWEEWEIGGGGVTFLSELNDVVLMSPIEDGDVLTYDSVTGMWINSPGAVGSGESLEQTLSIGNISGPWNIEMSDNQIIKAVNGTGNLNLRDGADNTVVLQSGSAYEGGWIYADRNTTWLGHHDGTKTGPNSIGVVVAAEGTTISDWDNVRVQDLGATGATSASVNRNVGVWLNARSSAFAPGTTNSVIMASDTVGFIQLTSQEPSVSAIIASGHTGEGTTGIIGASFRSSIMAAHRSSIVQSNQSAIIATDLGSIASSSVEAFIIGTSSGTIATGNTASGIIGGSGHIINSGLSNVLILGGSGVTANVSDRIYVGGELYIKTVNTDNTADEILVLDSNGVVTKRNISTLPTGGTGGTGDLDWVLLGSPATDIQMGVDGTILPFSNDNNDIGSTTLRFKDIYLGSTIDFSTDLTFRNGANNIAIIESGEVKISRGLTIDSELDFPGFPGRATGSVVGIASLSLGYDNNIAGYAAVGIGEQLDATNSYSIAHGFQSLSSGFASIAFHNSTASASYATAFGQGSNASDINSFAGGFQGIASAYAAFAWGLDAQAKGQGSFSLGGGTIAGVSPGGTPGSGRYSFAINLFTSATGDQSFAGGFGAILGADPVIASGVGSFNFSTTTDTSGATGASGTGSIILGGIDGENSGTHSILLGGTEVTLTDNDTTAFGTTDVKFIVTPTLDNAEDDLLAINASGVVVRRSAASIISAVGTPSLQDVMNVGSTGTVAGNIQLTSTGGNFNFLRYLQGTSQSGIYPSDGNLLMSTTNTAGIGGITMQFNLTTGAVINDTAFDKGLRYQTDYSAVGTLDPRWIPDYGAVEQAIVDATPSPTIQTPDDKFLNAIATTADGDPASNGTITNTPVDGCYVEVRINGVEYEVGNGVTNKVCYFADPATPTLARGFSSSHANGQVQAGDKLYWNGSIIGFQLLNGWRVSFHYLTN